METVDKLWIGLILTVLGMGTTFVVLIFLAYTFKLMEYLFGGKKKVKTDAVVTEGPVTGMQSAVSASGNDIAAVISAAIAACAAGATQLVVRSIRRSADGTPVWGRMGRQDQMASRL